MIKHMILITGTEQWFEDGDLHKKDGPAILFAGGNEVWYRDGRCHRADGPAEIWQHGKEFYNNLDTIEDEQNFIPKSLDDFYRKNNRNSSKGFR